MTTENLSKQLIEIFLKEEDSFTDILGQLRVKSELKSALAANRHILIIGPPGIGKTTIAKNLAKLLPEITVNDCPFNCNPNNPICPDCKSLKDQNKNPATKIISGIQRFVRVQGSPDLTAEDLIGDIDPIKALKFGPLSMEAFSPGKLFKANSGILFFDELNRCPEKLQNALLQVLQERVATIGPYDVDLEANFIFIATMNPADSSTEPLSDVLLDRFDVTYMEYPESHNIEKSILDKHGTKFVEISEELTNIIISFVRELRESDKLERVPSVRATLGLFERTGTNALLKGKQSADFSDVHDAIVSVLSHRIKLKPSAQYLQSPIEFIKEHLKSFMERNNLEIADKSDAG
ncbi:AAA domain-containing protein [Candidatus Woesearchaeota archaeon]|jgi:magnesium chelatase subunit I|nr:AAA domain-containing protein [Candidatus Woesearchaeota archaeon]MBT6519614.1 AAA domain-containing protein [Candidatus Woesearchaeota archaeon]MBT7367529.1 AAA domain-containing protein [Candidatus Woesearchaeota archaeon]